MKHTLILPLPEELRNPKISLQMRGMTPAEIRAFVVAEAISGRYEYADLYDCALRELGPAEPEWALRQSPNYGTVRYGDIRYGGAISLALPFAPQWNEEATGYFIHSMTEDESIGVRWPDVKAGETPLRDAPTLQQLVDAHQRFLDHVASTAAAARAAARAAAAAESPEGQPRPGSLASLNAYRNGGNVSTGKFW